MHSKERAVKWSWPKLRKRRNLSHCDSYPIRNSNSVRTKYEPGVQIKRQRCSVPNMNCTLERAAALLLSQALSQIWTIFWNTLLHVRYLCRKMPPAQLLSCVPFCRVRTAAAAAWEPLCCVCPIVWDVHLSSFLRWSLLPHLSTFSRISASFVRITCVSTPQSVLTMLVTKVRVLWDISHVDYWSYRRFRPNAQTIAKLKPESCSPFGQSYPKNAETL